MFKKHNLLALLLILSSGNLALANTKSVEVDSAFYLLDLVEVSIHDKPFLTDAYQASPEVAAKIQGFVGSNVSQTTLQILQKKIARIAAKYPNSIFKDLNLVIERSRLSLVDFPLKSEVDSSPLNVPNAVQVGSYRRETAEIQISRMAFKQLNDANQAAVLLHELLGATGSWNDSRQASTQTAMFFNANKQADSFEQRWKVAATRSSSSTDVGVVLGFAPDLVNEWMARRLQPITSVEAFGHIIFPPAKAIFRATEIFSAPLANWAKSDSDHLAQAYKVRFYNEYSKGFHMEDLDFKTFPQLTCITGSLVLLNGALDCKDASNGDLQVFKVNDPSISMIVKVDHVKDEVSKVDYSGYFFILH